MSSVATNSATTSITPAVGNGSGTALVEPEITSRSGRKIKPKRYLLEEIEENVSTAKRAKLSIESPTSSQSQPIAISPQIATAPAVTVAAAAASVTKTNDISDIPTQSTEELKIPKLEKISSSELNKHLSVKDDAAIKMNENVQESENSDDDDDDANDDDDDDDSNSDQSQSNVVHKKIISNFQKMKYLYKDNLLLALLPNDRICGIKCNGKIEKDIAVGEMNNIETDTAQSLIDLKKNIETGKITIDCIMNDDKFVMDPEISDTHLIELKMEKRMAEKLHLNYLLTNERKLVEIDHKIKSSCQLSSADPLLCVELLKKLKGMLHIGYIRISKVLF